MPVVAALSRHPVKSFQGEQLDALEFQPGGARGDRRYAVRDRATGKVLTAKRVGTLLYGSARTIGDDVVLSLPGGVEVAASDPTVHDRLSAWLARDVELAEARVELGAGEESLGANGAYEFSFNAVDPDEQPDTEYYDIPIPAGAFLDLCDVHLLCRASVDAIAAQYPDGVWDLRRLRPTVFVEATDDGYAEDAWVGRHVHLGEVTIHVELLTMRCVMPTRPQPAYGGSPELARDKQVSRVIADGHGGNLGIYAKVVTGGVVRVGDEVRVEPQ